MIINSEYFALHAYYLDQTSLSVFLTISTKADVVKNLLKFDIEASCPLYKPFASAYRSNNCPSCIMSINVTEVTLIDPFKNSLTLQRMYVYVMFVWFNLDQITQTVSTIFNEN